MNHLKCKEKSGNALSLIIYTKLLVKTKEKIKKDFKDLMNDCFIDKNTGRLIIKFNKTKVKNK